ncbi:MAG: glycosyltransferase family 2 protein [Janthinobacterium lividum]
MSNLLTVCVPTYNRASELIQCLQSIDEALACLRPEDRSQVTVIVSDNASPDNTQSQVEAHQESFPWLQYHRNPQNVGGERNFYGLIQRSVSEYVWVLGDDDRMKPNALRVALDRLARGFDLLICNCSSYMHGFTVQRKLHHFPLMSDREFDDPEEVMKAFGIELGYISIQIFRRTRFLAVSYDEYQGFAEYGHSFMYGVYAGLLPQSRTLYIAEPLIKSQGDSSANFDWYKFFAIGTALVFETLQAKGYSPASVLAGKHQALRDSVLPHVLVSKRDGLPEQRNLFQLLLPYYSRNWLFWMGLPSLLLPGSAIRFVNVLIKNSHRRRRALVS